MIATDLCNLLLQHITPDQQLILNAELFPEAGTLAGYLTSGAASGQIIINEAVVDFNDSTTTVRGKASFLKVQNMAVVLTGGGDEKSTWLRLIATDVPDSWRLPHSFGALPQYWATTPDEFGLVMKDSFLGELRILKPSFVLATCADEDGIIQPGLNLLGRFVLDTSFADGIATDILRWLKGVAPLPLVGTIRLLAGQPPLIDLRATLDDTVQFDIGSLHLTEPFIWMHTVMPPETPTPESRMELAAKLMIGTPNPMAMIISTELLANFGEFVFRGFCEDESFSLANGLTDIAALLGLSADRLALPSELQALSTLYVREVQAGLSTVEKRPEFISATLALPVTPPWDTPIPKLTITKVQTGWSLFFGAPQEIQGYVAGSFRLGKTKPVDINVSAAFPDFQIIGRLDPDSATPISITDAIGHFLDIPDLPEIDIADLYLSARPTTRELSISGMLTDDWSFALGKLPRFAIREVYFALNHSAIGFSGSVGGQATLGSAAFHAVYAFPGTNFVLDGKIPSISLQEVLDLLCDESIAIPDGLNFTLLESDIAITKAGQDYKFFLMTTVKECGTLLFEIQRSGIKGWGAAVGVDLTLVQKLSELPGFTFLDQLDLTFERMILVLSSVDLPAGYIFPDMSTYKATTPAASGQVMIPSGIGAPKQGINFYARFAFGDRTATHNGALLKFYDYFSLQKVTLDVGIQIALQNSSMSALLMAGAGVSGATDAISCQRHNLDITAYLAAEITQSSAAFFLRGQLLLPVPNDQQLRFTMELAIFPNGFYVAGNMNGSWSAPFGLENLTVSDLALAVGASWEGIPLVGVAGALAYTRFAGSIAVLVNTVDPQNSLLAGSLSDVTLADIIDIFIGAIGDETKEIEPIREVLAEIGLKGINRFTIPACYTANLDAQKWDDQAAAEIAQAFASAEQAIQLSSGAQDLLRVVGKTGEIWYLTDKRNKMKHYELKKVDDHIEVASEAQLYFAPANTRIGSADFTRGFYIAGQLDFCGFEGQIQVEIDTVGKGIAGDGTMTPIKVFGGLLKITSATDENIGPHFSVATFAQPDKPEPFQSPHISASGKIDFLGISGKEVDISLSKEGFHIVLGKKQLGLNGEIACDLKLEPLSFSGGGEVGVDVNTEIDLSCFELGSYKLGSYKLVEANCPLALTFGVSGEDLNTTASGKFYFDVPAFNQKLGPYDVNLNLVNVDQPFDKLEDLAVEEIKKTAKIVDDLGKLLLKDAQKFTQLAEEGFLALTDTLDNVLQKAFKITLADIKATTSCFAGERLAPHMQTRAATTPTMLSLAAASPSSTDDDLARLRQLRQDLDQSAMGKWILNIYNKLSEPLVHLYDYQPSTADVPSFKEVLDAYDGDMVYHHLLGMLQTLGSAKPISLTPDFVNKALSIVAATIDLADAYAKTGDLRQQQEGMIIIHGIEALLSQASIALGFANQGLTYEQIKREVAKRSPPPDPFAE